MHTSSSSPESGRARGAHAPSPGNNENSDTEHIPDSAAVVNRADRSLLEHGRNGTKLWAVQIGRRTHYEIEHGNRKWTYSLLWSAIAKLDRLSRERRAA
jgi:hypothetical protein